MNPLLTMRRVEKTYQMGRMSFQALKGIDLEIGRGELIAVVGPSGSGKSTLMNIMGCLDVPTGGEYLLDDRLVNTLNSNELADVRNRRIGFVFQAFNLLPYATAWENVELPLVFARASKKLRKERIAALLTRVGLADKFDNKPTEMSGGEMQRVAIARALANEPDIILADEPTGNLDSRSGGEIVKLFLELSQAGKTVIIITHDLNIARQTQRVIKIKDGLIDTNGNGNGAAVPAGSYGTTGH